MWAIAVPLIVFVAVVGPVWVVFHYLTVWKRLRAEQRNMSPEEAALQEKEIVFLRKRARALEARITTLERLLDKESASWKDGK